MAFAKLYNLGSALLNEQILEILDCHYTDIFDAQFIFKCFQKL